MLLFSLQWGIAPLADNVVSDKFFYQLTVCTGMRRGAGTKSKISFVLAGDSFDTGVRELIDEKGIKVNICYPNLLLNRIDLNHKKICRIFRFCSISFSFMKNNLIYNNFNVFTFNRPAVGVALTILSFLPLNGWVH